MPKDEWGKAARRQIGNRERAVWAREFSELGFSPAFQETHDIGRDPATVPRRLPPSADGQKSVRPGEPRVGPTPEQLVAEACRLVDLAVARRAKGGEKNLLKAARILDHAIQLVRKAIKNGLTDPRRLAIDRRMALLHSHPGWQSLGIC